MMTNVPTTPTATEATDPRFGDLVVELGLGRADEVEEIEPLTGGVASDIARVRAAGRDYCMKFALAKLRVAEEWFAPVHRNKSEYEWLRFASDVAPESAVRMFGRSERLNGFAMEYLRGDIVFLWKSALLDGQFDPAEAVSVARTLGRIHAASSRPGFDPAPFHNRDDFKALRIEPYLTFAARQHPDLAARLNRLAEMLYMADRVLVHGDVSPKNILFRDGFPVILDAECATMGDASFDPAFCLNHLILKAIHVSDRRADLLAGAVTFWDSYATHVEWEDAAALEARVCRLTPALTLARVDGKSPVEYLDPSEQAVTRAVAVDLIRNPQPTIRALTGRIATQLKEPFE